MTKSPRLTDAASQTTDRSGNSSPSLLLLATALDTTWRAFVPTIGGTFLGIGLDHLFGVKPIATIVCMIVGGIVSGLLIAWQIRSVRKPK